MCVQDSLDLEQADSLAVEASHRESFILPAHVSIDFHFSEAYRSICSFLLFPQAVF